MILTPDPIIEPHCLEGTRLGLAHSLNAPGPRYPKTSVLGSLTPSVGTAAIGGAGANGGVALKSGAVVLESVNVNEAERPLIGRALEASGTGFQAIIDKGGGVAGDKRSDRQEQAQWAAEGGGGRRCEGRCALRRTVEFVRSTVESVRCTVESVRATVVLACEAAHPRATWVGGCVLAYGQQGFG